jgi:hypothetical protein
MPIDAYLAAWLANFDRAGPEGDEDGTSFSPRMADFGAKRGAFPTDPA